MSRRVIILLVLVVAALSACGGGRAGEPGKIVPRLEARSAERDARSAAPEGGDTAASPAPRISLPADEKLLGVVDARLDADAAVEQVIALKKLGDLDSPVRVLVLDSAAATGGGQRYALAWQSSTAATSTRVFDLSVADLAGDHGLDIVVSGMNADGKLTLDVFRKNPPVGGQGTSFRSVASLSADDIRIETAPRPESYTTGQKNAESFTISAYTQDSSSRNVMDLVRVAYTWQAAEGRFVPGQVERIPGEKVEQKQLEKLYTSGDTESFEAFLDGTWIESRALADPQGLSRSYGMVHFQPRERRISVSTGDTEEIYAWQDSWRTIFDRLYVNAVLEPQNTAVNREKNRIPRTFSIRASSLNTLEITNQGNDPGDTASTAYTRITGDVRKRLLDSVTASVMLRADALSGTFADGKVRRITVQGSNLLWEEAGRSRAGVCVFFSLAGQLVMSIRFTAENGAPPETVNYVMDLREKRDLGRITRTLVLTPAQLTVSGYQEAVGDRLTLEQTVETPKK